MKRKKIKPRSTSKKAIEASNKKVKQAHSDSKSPLLAYHFVLPLINLYLQDSDILTRLVITGHAIKPALLNYKLKVAVTNAKLAFAKKLASPTRYLPVYVVKIRQLEIFDKTALFSLVALEDIELSPYFRYKLSSGSIPPTVKRITLPNTFNNEIEQGALPAGLECLHFCYLPTSQAYYDNGRWREQARYKILPRVLPASLIELTLSSLFNQELEPGILPPALQIVRFGNTFNQRLSPLTIPKSVVHISFGNNFDQKLVPGSLPKALQSLKFGCYFNQPLDSSVLPASVSELELGFGYSLPFTLPSSVTKLTLARSLRHAQGIHSLGSLTELVLGPDHEPMSANTLPPLLTKLSIRQPVTMGSIPASVIILNYDYYSSIPVGAIPSSVRHLTLSHCDHPLLPGVIPASVVHLKLDHMAHAIVERSIPSTVQYLTLGKNFTQPLSDVLLPGSLKERTYHEQLY